MMYRRLIAGLTVAAFLLSSRAEADPSEADRKAARALAAQAHNAVDNKDYSAAADLFARADALVHVPTMLLGLARARVELGKLVAAREAYNQIIQEGVRPNAPKPFFEALDLARQELAALNPRIAWVKMTITGAENAIVLLDGVEVPRAAVGAPQAVDPGRHVLTATGTRGARAEATVTVGEGMTETVTLDLRPAAAEPAVAPPVGPAPDAKPPHVAPPLTKPRLVAGVAPGPASKSSARKTAGFVSLGVGAAGLVLGGVTGAFVLKLHGTLDDQCEDGVCPASMDPKLDTYNTLGLVSTIGFIAGGAAAGLGVVLLVTAPKNDEAMVGLMMGPTSGGGVLGAAGRF